MKNKKRFFVMFLANTLLLVFLAPVSSHAFFQEVKSEFRYQGASVWQAVLDPLADMFEPWFAPNLISSDPLYPKGEVQTEPQTKELLVINNPQTNTPSKQEVLNWIKDILKLQNTETYTSVPMSVPSSVPSQNIYNTYPTEIREIRTSGGSQGLADSLSHSLTNIDSRFTQITNTLTNSYTFLSPSLTNATLTGETTIDSHLLLTATSAPSTTTNRLYNTGGDLYWAGSLIGGATTGNWTSDGTNVWRSGGAVGIGTTTPGYKLSVAGSGFFDGGTVTASSFIATSSITAPSFNSTSAGTGFQISGTSVLNYSGGVLRVNDLGGGISLRTNSADRLFIDTAGLVGIGTTTPFASLSVNNIAGTPGFVVGSSTATSFIVDKNGRVGVGTANPGVKLDIYDNLNTIVATRLVNQSTGAAAQVEMKFAVDNDTTNYFSIGKAGDNSSLGGAGYLWNIDNAPIAFATNNTEKMRLTSGGSLGLGISSPQQRLHIFGSSGDVRVVTDAVSASYSGLNFYEGGTDRGGVFYRGTDDRISIWTSNGTSAERMSITDTGNIGIGSTTPWGLLSVNANGLAAGTPQFVVGSSTATNFIVANGGNVGIGTTTPGNKLSVQGNVDIYNTSGGGFNLMSSNKNINLITNSSGDFLINDATTGTGRMIITSAGKVGLGNYYGPSYYPQNKLSVEGSASIGYAYNTDVAAPSNGLIVNGNVGIGTTGPGAKLEIDSVSGTNANIILKAAGPDNAGIDYYRSAAFKYNLGVGGGSDSFALYNAATTNYSWLVNTSGQVIFNDGNVGIGTTSPSAKLSVKGGGTTTGRAFAISNSSDAEKFTVLDNGNVGIGTAAPGALLTVNGIQQFPGTRSWNIQNNGLALTFGDTIDGTALTINRASISPGIAVTTGGTFGGNVTITNNVGVTGGNSTLALIGGGQGANVSFSSIGGGDRNWQLITASGGDPLVLGQGSFSVYDATAGASRVLINSSGQLGIATTSPWRTLSVAGTAAFSGLVNDSTGYYACVNTTTGQLATSTTACGASSERFKENIQDLSYGLSEVLSLRPVSFDYKDSYIKDSTHQLGFIAEEVDLLIPELVAKDAEGQIQGLDYPKFTSVIVKALQELNQKFLAMFESLKTLVKTKEVQTEKIRLEGDFCIDETCVTKDQFKQMLLQAGVGATQTVGSSNPEAGIQETENQTASSTEETTEETSTSTPEISSSTPLMFIGEGPSEARGGEVLGEVSVPSSVPLGEVLNEVSSPTSETSTTPEI